MLLPKLYNQYLSPPSPLFSFDILIEDLMHDPRLGMVSMKPLSVLLLAIPFIKPIYDTFSMVCQSIHSGKEGKFLIDWYFLGNKL